MASKPRPIICPPSLSNGFLFDRAELVLSEDGDIIDMMDLSDLFQNVSSFSKIRRKIRPLETFAIDQSDVGDDLGFVSNIVISIKYPKETKIQNRYAYWYYMGVKYHIGELMVLTGERVDLIGGSLGWTLTPGDVFYETGGIVIENPHASSIINVDILIAR